MDVQNLAVQSGLWGMIEGAGPMVKLVLLLLLIFSITSWAIILYKVRLLKRIEGETKQFYTLFWEKRQFKAIYEECGRFKTTPLTRIFVAGFTELKRIRGGAGDPSDAAHSIPPDEGLDNIVRAMRRASMTEINVMEKAVTFLATTGNTAPFIGLFGTVWGIMNAFRNIGLKGVANLAVVAPGISEALIATAMGLVAAIPAVIAYNHLTTRITRITAEMEGFSADFLGVVERHLDNERKRGV
ncbi:MAG: protein TolQ [Thermodesulfobacteriota bacterium]